MEKSAAIRSVKHKAKQNTPASASVIKPGEFQTLWGRNFGNYEKELEAKLAAAEQERLLKEGRITHLKALRAKGLTLQEIGELVGLTRERVRQLLSHEKSARPSQPDRRCGKRVQRKDDRFYFLWRGIMGRAGKGKYYEHVSICKRWQTYRNFENDMWASYQEHVRKHGEFDTTIDRINIYSDYKPSNCRWATKLVQNQNKRKFRGIGKPATLDRTAIPKLTA